MTPTGQGEAAIRSLVEGHRQLADQLFAHLPTDRLEAFAGTLDDTIVTFHA